MDVANDWTGLNIRVLVCFVVGYRMQMGWFIFLRQKRSNHNTVLEATENPWKRNGKLKVLIDQNNTDHASDL